jgi:hypothetical protein
MDKMDFENARTRSQAIPDGFVGETPRPESDPSVALKQLLQIIEDFKSRLDDDHEVGAFIANGELPFHVRDVSRQDALFLFKGVDNQDQEVLAVQHFSQLNFQLVKLKKIKPSTSIGFRHQG